jgi:hypothetical protein
MAYPISFGKNNLSSKSLFYQRKKYDNIVFPDTGEISEKPEVRNIDLFYKRPFYGRININSIPVISDVLNFSFLSNDFTNLNNFSYMKKLNTPKGKDRYAMNFVIDAFKDMQQYVNNSCAVRGTSNAQSRITPLGIVKANTGANVNYLSYVSSVYAAFINTIKNIETSAKIKNFQDFYYLFSDFLLEYSRSNPVSFSSFITSKFCPANISGLVLEVDAISYSDDELKTSLFLNDINFDFFAKGAARFGFRIDKHVPYRLIADINTETMLDYMKAYGINSKEELFDKQFVPAYSFDIRHLKELFYNSYKTFTDLNPQYEEFEDIKNCSFKKNYMIGDRENLNIVDFYTKFDNSFWINLYVKIKLEENHIKDQNSYILSNLVSTANDIYSSETNNVIGLANTLKFINEQITNFYNYSELNAALTTE